MFKGFCGRTIQGLECDIGITFSITIYPKKVLYTKSLNASNWWAGSAIAYYDLDDKQEHVVPNIQTGCGSPPKWAPNGFHIAFHVSSCSRGWPGGILSLTDLNGSFQEYLVPSSNDNPAYFMFSPDGNSILISFSSYSSSGAVDNMGGPASFYIMSLARSVPEFSSILLLIAAATIGVVAVICRLCMFSWKK